MNQDRLAETTSAAGLSLSGAVLAGGLSRRMGQDKALVSLRPGEPPLAGLVLDRLVTVADDRFLIASDRPHYARFGVRIVPDHYPGAGALGGIATALMASVHECCFVVACDMPLLNLALLKWMAAEPRDYDVLIPHVPGKSRQGGDLVYHTLHAIYARSCLAAIEPRLAAGDLRVISFFPDVRVRSIDLARIARFDPHLHSFFNANTPEAAIRAAELLDRENASPADTVGQT